jgi:site-specific recombinase XerD
MEIKAHISIYLDTRRKKNDGTFPVKLRVFQSYPKQQKLYATAFNMTQQEFDSTWTNDHPRQEFREKRAKLYEIESKAQQIIDAMAFFTFELFEKRLFMKPGIGSNVKRQFDLNIESLLKSEQYGTSECYTLCIKSLEAFLKYSKSTYIENLQFQEISPGFLKEYEKYMVIHKGRSYTTVSIYLRTLRALFNKVIKEELVKREYYPFGSKKDGKYEIPYSQKVKKAMTNAQLKTLFESEPQTPEQEKAKDFWFFSYSCSGMNMKDILQLRCKDFDGETIKFYRAKTINTTRNKKELTVYLNEYSSSIIEKYSDDKAKKDDYLFPILEKGMDLVAREKAIANFIRFVNQHMALLCKQNSLVPVSTYWARHSFATNSIRKGASMEFIQESLGHGSIATTQYYFAGFEDGSKRNFAQTLMDFN